MANIAAINNKQHGGANKLETLVHSFTANLQAKIHVIDCLRIKKSWKSLKKGCKVEKLEKRQLIFFKYILWKKLLDSSKKALDHEMSLKIDRSFEKSLGVTPVLTPPTLNMVL